MKRNGVCLPSQVSLSLSLPPSIPQERRSCLFCRNLISQKYRRRNISKLRPFFFLFLEENEGPGND